MSVEFEVFPSVEWDSSRGVRYFENGEWGPWKRADDGGFELKRRENGSCLCDEGKHHVEGSVASLGWYFHAGQCCDCLNIRVYQNGATPKDWQDDPDYAENNSDEIHICDLPAFIAMLQKIAEAVEPGLSGTDEMTAS